MKVKRKTFATCPNCGTSLHSSAKYCATCGQENHNLNVPLKHLLGELLESTLHFDMKSFKTIRALIFKPGFLTNEFNLGKRKSYVPPLRLYVFVSFTFFLVLNLAWKEYQSPTNSPNKKNLIFRFNFTV
jgi:hypothetical protein